MPQPIDRLPLPGSPLRFLRRGRRQRLPSEERVGRGQSIARLPANPVCARRSRVLRSLLLGLAGPRDDPVNGLACPAFAILDRGIVGRSCDGNRPCHLTFVLVLVLDSKRVATP